MAVSKFIDWERIDEALPAFLTSTLIAFTYSIANGVIAGLIAFAVLKSAALAAGQFKRSPLPLSPEAASHPPPLALGTPDRRHSTSMLALHSAPHSTHTATGLTSKDDPLPGSPVAYYVTPNSHSHSKRRPSTEGSSRRLLSQSSEQSAYGATEHEGRY